MRLRRRVKDLALGARSALQRRVVVEVRWVKVNDYYAETECRSYRCRKIRTGELVTDSGNLIFGAGELRYQLIGPNGMQIGPLMESFAQVKGRADMHARAAASS